MLRDRPRLLDAVLGRGQDAEERPAPGPVVLLLPDDGLHRLRLDDQGLERLQPGLAGGRQLPEGAQPNALAAVLQQPGQRESGTASIGPQPPMGPRVWCKSDAKIVGGARLRAYGGG